MKKLFFFLGAGICLPYAYVASLFSLRIPYVELVVTTRCSLNCAGCANLMNLYEKQYDIEMDTLLKSIDQLISSVGAIQNFTVLGGEPFMRRDLSIILDRLTSDRKIKNIKVTTNGTIIPPAEVMKSLQNKKITVSVSEYAAADGRREKLTKALEGNKIRYFINRFEAWENYGSLEKGGYDTDTLIRAYKACASAECKTILNGNLFSCPRASHGMDLNLIPPDNDDFISLLNSDPEEIRAGIKRLYAKPYVAACDCCAPPWARKSMGCGMQEERKKITP